MGRDSAKPAMAMAMALVVLSCLALEAQAAVYYVGGRAGWSFSVSGWPRGKTFRAGDVLVFNYVAGQHNVAPVDGRGYGSCTGGRGAGVLRSGRDRVRLSKGQNYFICTFAGHCQAGMKIAVNAL